MRKRTLSAVLLFTVLAMTTTARLGLVRAQQRQQQQLPPNCDGSEPKMTKCTYTSPNPTPKEAAACDNTPNAKGGCDTVIAYNSAMFSCTDPGSATTDCKSPDGTPGTTYTSLCREDGSQAQCYIYRTCKVVDVMLPNGSIIKSCADDNVTANTKYTKVNGSCNSVPCFPKLPLN